MKIKSVVLQLDKQDLVDVLANFYMIGAYWYSLIDWEEKDYKEAKETLLITMEDDDICMEHIWAEMLINQKPLILTAYDDEEKYELTYANICVAIGYLISNGRLSNDLEEWDSGDCDCVIQQALFGDVIYG